MFRRLRQLFESIIYAGMRPGQTKGEPDGLRWLGPLAGPVNRFLSGGARPDDPLYLSNRTLWQRVRIVVLAALPIIAIGAFLGVALYRRADRTPAADLTAEEVARRTLPNLAKEIHIETNRDVLVVDVLLERTSPLAVAGTVANNTNHVVRSAELSFDLTDGNGSQVGAVATTVKNLPPNSHTAFRFPVKQTDAAFVLVRDIHVE